MSKGPGRIQRAISAIFAAEPDNAFLTVELCERIYPSINQIQKKHRVAVMRAAQRMPNLGWRDSEKLGGELVFFNLFSVISAVMAKEKGNNVYRNNDSRAAGRRAKTEKQLRARLREDDTCRELIAEGSIWWLQAEINKAEARGDHDAVDKMTREQELKRASLDRLTEALCASLKR